MKIGIFASGLTHLLFMSLILLAAAKSVKDPGTADAGGVDEQPAQTARADIAARVQSSEIVEIEQAGDEQARSRAPADEQVAAREAGPPESAPSRPERPAASEPAAPKTGKETDRPPTEEQQAEPAKPELSRNERLMRRLVAAYPEFLAGYEDNAIIWHDGTRMPFDDGREKSFRERLNDPDLEDQFYTEYPRGLRGVPPLEDIDPGRVRYEPFFTKMYGDCKRDKAQMQAKLEKVVWLPESYGKSLRVTSVNGVADALREVSAALDKLPKRFTNYLRPSAGTYHCRTIAGTDRFSVHAFGAAVDINAKYGDYWRWSQPEPGEALTYRNRIPWDIVEIFEQHGFIWGGKWYHYDTLHFEYRPELLNAAPRPPAPLPNKRPRLRQQAER